MRILWTLAKVILALAIAIPLGILAVGLAMGILGSLFGIAILVLRLAILGFIGYGAFMLGINGLVTFLIFFIWLPLDILWKRSFPEFLQLAPEFFF